jgi:DNA-directed RNA polymerase alpha subunit
MTISPVLVIEQSSKDSIKFRLKNTSAAFANTLRRIIIAHVPTLAVEFVHVYENTSPLCDE